MTEQQAEHDRASAAPEAARPEGTPPAAAGSPTPPAARFNAERGWLRCYGAGVPHDVDDPTGSLADLLDRTAREFPDRVALEFFGAETTYRDFHRQVQRVAGGLHHLGVRAGDRVALLLPNCPQHMIAFYAVVRLGAIVVEHNPLYTPDELRTQFRDHGARVAIGWDAKASVLREIAADSPLTTIVSVNMTEAMPPAMRLRLALPVEKARQARAKLTSPAPGTIPFRRLLRSRPLPADHPGPGREDLATLQYTSGTTGVPRGAMISHANLQVNARMGWAWMPKFRRGEEVIYAVLPMFHAFGVVLTIVYSVLLGARAVLFPTFDINFVAEASRRHPPRFIAAVPPMFDRMAHGAQRRGLPDLSQVIYAVSGAMALNDRVVTRWESVSPGRLAEGYGLTEASPVVLVNPFTDQRRIGTIGIPFPSTTMKIVDPDDPDLREVDFGEVGELLVHGPQVFHGYWQRPADTAETLLPGGWLRTGDLVTEDRDGFVTVVDRKKELIITGGFNVAPSEVEKVVVGAPGIADAAVVGVPRGAQRAEVVTAVVVLAPGATFDEPAVRAYCREHLAHYKVPRAYVVWDELPRSLVGKVLRRKVRERLAAEAGAGPGTGDAADGDGASN